MELGGGGLAVALGRVWGVDLGTGGGSLGRSASQDPIVGEREEGMEGGSEERRGEGGGKGERRRIGMPKLRAKLGSTSTEAGQIQDEG